MNRRDQSGFTLVEMAVAGGLLGVVALIAGELLYSINKHSSDAQKRQSAQNDLQLLGGTLQKTFATGNINLMAFTGSADHPLSRLIVPQPGFCRDLTTVCPDQTALLYAAYDKWQSASLATFCALTPAVSTNPYTVLIDGYDTTYGNLGYAASTGLSVATVAGSVGFPINPGSALALFAPPIGTIWIADSKATPWNAVQDSSTGIVTGPGGVPLPAECAARLQDGPSPPLKKADSIYQISVHPLVLTQFTGGPVAQPSDVAATLTNIPLRLFGVTLRSMGVSPMPAPNTAKFYAGYSDCGVSATNVISCPGDPKIALSLIDRLRMDETFATPLYNAAAVAETATRFELLGGVMSQSTSCASPNCMGLNVPLNGSVPGISSSDETLDNLKSSGFSMIKQEAIKMLRLRLLVDAAQGKEENIDIQFP